MNLKLLGNRHHQKIVLNFKGLQTIIPEKQNFIIKLDSNGKKLRLDTFYSS